jgi:hypothetical protein
MIFVMCKQNISVLERYKLSRHCKPKNSYLNQHFLENLGNKEVASSIQSHSHSKLDLSHTNYCKTIYLLFKSRFHPFFKAITMSRKKSKIIRLFLTLSLLSSLVVDTVS